MGDELLNLHEWLWMNEAEATATGEWKKNVLQPNFHHFWRYSMIGRTRDRSYMPVNLYALD